MNNENIITDEEINQKIPQIVKEVAELTTTVLRNADKIDCDTSNIIKSYFRLIDFSISMIVTVLPKERNMTNYELEIIKDQLNKIETYLDNIRYELEKSLSKNDSNFVIKLVKIIFKSTNIKHMFLITVISYILSILTGSFVFGTFLSLFIYITA